MSPARFGEILASGLPNGWISGLVGRDGRLIARNVDEARYIGTDNPEFLEVATQSEGIWTGLSRDGIAIAGVYIRSPLSGWIVSVAVPETILREPVQSLGDAFARRPGDRFAGCLHLSRMAAVAAHRCTNPGSCVAGTGTG